MYVFSLLYLYENIESYSLSPFGFLFFICLKVKQGKLIPLPLDFALLELTEMEFYKMPVVSMKRNCLSTLICLII
jgi:hypothetical protein